MLAHGGRSSGMIRTTKHAGPDTTLKRAARTLGLLCVRVGASIAALHPNRYRVFHGGWGVGRFGKVSQAFLLDHADGGLAPVEYNVRVDVNPSKLLGLNIGCSGSVTYNYTAPPELASLLTASPYDDALLDRLKSLAARRLNDENPRILA